MLSFFRKSKQEEPAAAKPVNAAVTANPKAPEPAPPVAAEAAAPPPVATTQMQAGDELVVFENISAEAGSIVEEAAVYYANNMAEQAVAALSQYIQDHPGKKEMQPWLMLFDLYQLKNNSQAFNELSLQFVVKFERSAPIWKTPAAAPAPVKKADAAHKDLISLGNRLADSEQMEKLCQMAKSASTARVNVGDITEVELGGCKLMQEGLHSCRKKGKSIQIEGVERLVETLKKKIATDGQSDEDRQAWLLLFELYQWLGREAEYEDLAIEYAVTFEISPPAWEAMKAPLTMDKGKSLPTLAVTPEKTSDESFALSGVISESSQSRLDELIKYAEGKQEVRINLSEVTRVDFVAVGTFMGALINLTQAGKKVLILEANEMVQALFHMMGIQEFATLIRKKSR
ncbi:MAG: STAS domain-containing protein [Pseudomonadota bacterium]